MTAGSGSAGVFMVLEDEEADAVAVRRSFARIGTELHHARDGREALDLLRDPGTPPITAILVDLQMPRMNGFEFLEAQKSDPDLRRTPVIIMTSSDAEADVLKGYDLGASGYVRKPMTTKLLNEVVSDIVEYWGETSITPARFARPDRRR